VLSALLLVVAGIAGIFGYIAHHRQLEMSEQLKDRVLYAATSGDFEYAKEVVVQAEAAGVTPGWTHIMQGQILLLHGDYHEARIELEYAGSLLKASTATFAMLTLVCEGEGDEDSHMRMLTALEKLPTREFADYLFKGCCCSARKSPRPDLTQAAGGERTSELRGIAS
jgi:hypothetical protein